MKRTIPLILIATLTACASTPNTVPLATPYPATATESSTATPAPTTEIAPFYHVSDTLNTGDAYYSFGQKPGYALLLKTDYATATQTVFCEVPGCTHDTNACPAYFPGYYSDYIIAGDNPCYVCHISRDMGSMTWDEYYETNVKF